jgi:methylenetetrahydrofolate--tRNA-(uracil-5-)-methyltransferase
MDGDGMVHVVGGGLAGCEAALQLARLGVRVVLHEMRPAVPTPAHRTGDLAEIVCSNSLKSTDPATASGAFKLELRRMGCRLLELAAACTVPAGAALGVDRERFSRAVTAAVAEAGVELRRGEVVDLPEASTAPWILAPGPLASPALREAILVATGGGSLHFFDAIAPTVTLESLDQDRLYRAARWDRGEADYLNAALDAPAYARFHAELVAAERTPVPDFDRADLFLGCQPVEEIADSGPETLAFGPLRPVGLRHPSTGLQPHAVVQLRQENAEGTLYGLVGFQTRLRHGEQKRIFRLIPGLENAEFVRYGQLHRNFYLDTPRILDRRFALPARPHLRFAGQVTGVEGYVESIASGLWTAWLVAAELRGVPLSPPPRTTLLGALLDGFLFDTTSHRLSPMNVNFGLLPPLLGGPHGRRRKALRIGLLCERALSDLESWLGGDGPCTLLAGTGERC